MEDSKLFITDDGSHSIYSKKYGVSYHSKFGALEESQHVFINAALRFKAVIQQKISILEIGFGTGLNTFVTFFEAKKRNLIIDYKAVEAYPISIKQAEQLNYSNLLEPEESSDVFMKLHQAPWNTPFKLNEQFIIEKILKRFQVIDFDNQFDIIYFDAFAPDAQPELWSEDILAKMYKALLPDGILVTYCAKGSVKRSLKGVGFTVEALPGPPRKREMTRATK
jgi:tRNA U34 5-methylaminomethyl-2-thiouridine-forming methyltransferase MnmC